MLKQAKELGRGGATSGTLNSTDFCNMLKSLIIFTHKAIQLDTLRLSLRLVQDPFPLAERFGLASLGVKRLDELRLDPHLAERLEFCVRVRIGRRDELVRDRVLDRESRRGRQGVGDREGRMSAAVRSRNTCGGDRDPCFSKMQSHAM